MIARCPRHHCIINFTTREGYLVEIGCVKCVRRQRQECLDGCGAHVGRRWRCPRCQTLHRNHVANLQRRRTCRFKPCKALVVIGSKRQYCCDDHQRLAKNAAYIKRYWKNPAFRAHRLESKTAWRASPAGRVSYLKTKRKGQISRTWGFKSRELYLAAMKAQNLKRVDAHRAWSHEHQCRFDDENRPRCATCGDVVPWSGLGRPRKYCPPCHPWRKS